MAKCCSAACSPEAGLYFPQGNTDPDIFPLPIPEVFKTRLDRTLSNLL